MKISIYTPSHKPDGLLALGKSIQSQSTNAEIEWIIAINGGCRIPREVEEMPFACILEAPVASWGSVGALKGFACQNATGDILVEADHDDELLPWCLDAICEALVGGGNKFFYSATYETKGGEPNLFGKGFGWEHAELDGLKYNLPFPASARSLCEIFYAPNHVRAWTREAYEKAGGYNASLDVCDDQELLIKTYLAGAEFIMDERPLYWQKVSDASTQIKRNARIQQKQAELRDEYLEPLALEWSKRNGLAALDFGGAHSCPKGYIPVDRYKVEGGIQCNLENGIPLPDKSVGVIRARDFLEHIPIGKVVPLMNEIHRVLAHGGFLISSTPSTDGRGAFCDPTHVSFWNQLSWRYYCIRQFANYVPEIQCKFQAVLVETIYPSEWHKKENVPYVVANLCADHGERLPGLKTI